jgi:prepilin-type N-terminal cleavage/methylation domain-containing protein
MNQQRNVHPPGFTLIEVIVVIAILAIVAGAMAPLAVRSIDSARQDLTVKRQQAIYQAILGDPSAPGSGFLSDIGRPPNSALTELAAKGALPNYAIQPCGVGMGWRGPYLLEGVDNLGQPLDGWGTPMDFINGQIRSAGPDHSMAASVDNILYPSVPITLNNVTGNIILAAMALNTGGTPSVFAPAGGQAIIYYAQDGVMQSWVMASPAGSYNIPMAGATLYQGIHAIRVTGDPDGAGPQPSITNTITVYCPGGGTVHKTAILQ